MGKRAQLTPSGGSGPWDVKLEKDWLDYAWISVKVKNFDAFSGNCMQAQVISMSARSFIADTICF